MKYALLNYYAAIYSGALELRIGEGKDEQIINQDTIEAKSHELEQARVVGRGEITDYLIALKNESATPIRLPLGYESRLYLMEPANPERPDSIIHYMRKPLQKVNHWVFWNGTPVRGVFIVSDESKNFEFAEIEGVTHDKWNERYKIVKDAKTAAIEAVRGRYRPKKDDMKTVELGNIRNSDSRDLPIIPRPAQGGGSLEVQGRIPTSASAPLGNGEIKGSGTIENRAGSAGLDGGEGPDRGQAMGGQGLKPHEGFAGVPGAPLPGGVVRGGRGRKGDITFGPKRKRRGRGPAQPHASPKTSLGGEFVANPDNPIQSGEPDETKMRPGALGGTGVTGAPGGTGPGLNGGSQGTWPGLDLAGKHRLSELRIFQGGRSPEGKTIYRLSASIDGPCTWRMRLLLAGYVGDSDGKLSEALSFLNVCCLGESEWFQIRLQSPDTLECSATQGGVFSIELISNDSEWYSLTPAGA